MTVTEIAALVAIAELNECIQQLDNVLQKGLLEPACYSPVFEPVYTAIDFLMNEMPSGSLVVTEFRDASLNALPDALQPDADIAERLGAVDCALEEIEIGLDVMESVSMRFRANSQAALNAALDRMHRFTEIESEEWKAHADMELTHVVLARASEFVDRLISVMTEALAAARTVLAAFDRCYPDYALGEG